MRKAFKFATMQHGSRDFFELRGIQASFSLTLQDFGSSGLYLRWMVRGRGVLDACQLPLQHLLSSSFGKGKGRWASSVAVQGPLGKHRCSTNALLA